MLSKNDMCFTCLKNSLEADIEYLPLGIPLRTGRERNDGITSTDIVMDKRRCNWIPIIVNL